MVLTVKPSQTLYQTNVNNMGHISVPLFFHFVELYNIVPLYLLSTLMHIL